MENILTSFHFGYCQFLQKCARSNSKRPNNVTRDSVLPRLLPARRLSGRACPPSAPDISGCRADNFQFAENEMVPHIDMFRAMARKSLLLRTETSATLTVNTPSPAN
jgi:hypothetical protein